jgi:hypothetical protein
VLFAGHAAARSLAPGRAPGDGERWRIERRRAAHADEGRISSDAL